MTLVCDGRVQTVPTRVAKLEFAVRERDCEVDRLRNLLRLSTQRCDDLQKSMASVMSQVQHDVLVSVAACGLRTTTVSVLLPQSKSEQRTDLSESIRKRLSVASPRDCILLCESSAR